MFFKIYVVMHGYLARLMAIRKDKLTCIGLFLVFVCWLVLIVIRDTMIIGG